MCRELTRAVQEGLPSSLVKWLHRSDSRHRPITDVTVVFGPDGGYVAWEKHAITWDSIPSGLETKLKGWLRRTTSSQDWLPSIVALGADGAWFALSRSGVEGGYIPKSCERLKDDWTYFLKRPGFQWNSVGVSMPDHAV